MDTLQVSLDDDHAPAETEYAVERILDHARFDDLYFRKMMFLKYKDPATDQHMGNFITESLKGDSVSLYVYKVRWLNYAEADDTWEPECNFWKENEQGRKECIDSLTQYKEKHNLKGHKMLVLKFRCQEAAKSMKNFGMSPKVYKELNIRFQEWADRIEKDRQKLQGDTQMVTNSLEANVHVDSINLILDSNEEGCKKGEKKKKAKLLDLEKPATSAAQNLTQNKAKEQKKKVDELKVAYNRDNDDSPTSSELEKTRTKKRKFKKEEINKESLVSDGKNQTEVHNNTKKQGPGGWDWETPAMIRYGQIQDRHKKERENDMRELFAGINSDASSGDDEIQIIKKKRPVKDGKRNNKAEMEMPSKFYATLKESGDFQVINNNMSDRVDKLDQENKVESKEVAVEKVPATTTPQKHAKKKHKEDVDPLGKILDSIRANKAKNKQDNEDEKTEIRFKRAHLEGATVLDSLPREGVEKPQQVRFKRQPPKRLQKKIEVARPNVPDDSSPKEDEIVIIDDKSGGKATPKKASKFVVGWYRFLMPPFLSIPYPRRRSQSCGAGMTDGGASFIKEFNEEFARQQRWRELIERGVRNEKPVEMAQSLLGKGVRMTQERREGGVYYTCADRRDKKYLTSIGHKISQPVPLREIDRDLVEKNKVNRKKKKDK